MKKYILIVSSVIALILVVGIWYIYYYQKPPPHSSPSDTREITALVVYTDNGFEPNTLNLKQQTIVTFKNNSSHPFQLIGNQGQSSPCIENTQFGACAPIPPGSSWSALFDYGGVWIYHDQFKPSTTMTVVSVGPILTPGAIRYPVDEVGRP